MPSLEANINPAAPSAKGARAGSSSLLGFWRVGRGRGLGHALFLRARVSLRAHVGADVVALFRRLRLLHPPMKIGLLLRGEEVAHLRLSAALGGTPCAALRFLQCDALLLRPLLHFGAMRVAEFRALFRRL